MPSFSQTDTAKKAIDPAHPIALPDSVLRKAARDIILGDQNDTIIKRYDKNISLLNRQIADDDSMLVSKNVIITQSDNIIKTWQDKYTFSLADNQALKEDYSSFKKKDAKKMGVAGAFIILALAAWWTKK